MPTGRLYQEKPDIYICSQTGRKITELLNFQIIDTSCIGKGYFSPFLPCKHTLAEAAGKSLTENDRVFLNHARQSGRAIMCILGDRDRRDVSVLTHACTASLRREVTPAPPLALLPAAGQHNDARMNLAIALTAARYGAATANYMEVLSLLKRTDPHTGRERVSGARCRDVLTGRPSRGGAGPEHPAFP